MKPSQLASRPLSGQEQDRLEAFVEGENDFGWEPMPFDMLQGFLCGIVSAGELIAAEDWLPWAFGIDPWPDPRPDAVQWFDLLKRYQLEQIEALEGREDAALVFYENSNVASNQYEFWCVGFLDGLEVASKPLEALGDPEEVEELLFPIRVLANALEDKERAKFDEKEWPQLVAECSEELWPAVVATYRYGNALRGKPDTVRRDAPKTGRNAACPCGSGKKFKACCGK
jgi:uncharacterized protein